MSTRDRPNRDGDVFSVKRDGGGADVNAAGAVAPAPETTVTRVIAFRIPRLDCANEERLICNRLGAMSGVTALTFDLRAHTLRVGYRSRETRPLVDALAELGLPPEAVGDETSAATLGAFTGPASEAATAERTVLFVPKLDSSTEVFVRGRLGVMEAVRAFEFNLGARTVTVSHAPGALDEIVAALGNMGFQADSPSGSAQWRKWFVVAMSRLAAAVGKRGR